jgi:trk system potassium uptake protein TrkH
MRFQPVINAFGAILFIFGLTLLVPLGVSLLRQDGAAAAFESALLLTLCAGAAVWAFSRPHRRVELKVRDGFLLVSLTWIVIPVFGALPLLFQIPGLSFTKAYFEATSGLTTTGSTVIVGLDALPYSINFWRCFLHWLGGMGVIVLAVAVLPLLGIGGRQIYKAETPGPMKEDSLTPRIAETAKGLWKIYTLITLACFMGLWLTGLDGWEAIAHAFSIMGLGGFSTHDASFGHFDNVPAEIVTMLFALIAGLNFGTHFLVLYSRSLRPYRHDVELRWFLGVLAASILGLTLYLLPFGVHDGLWQTLRQAAFHAVSLATSLGLATTDTAAWPMFAQLWILFLGSFAACAGSTGGGIKMMRAIILYKMVYREVLRAMHPRAVHPVRLGAQVVGDGVQHAVLAFGFVYMLAIVVLSLALAFSGMDLVTAFSAVVATLNNMGPGLNEIGTAGNFSGLSDFQTWVCAFAMILGRLELFTLLVVLTPAFWKK